MDGTRNVTRRARDAQVYKHETLQRLQDKGLDRLDDLFELMFEQAQGALIAVSPLLPKKDKPRKAQFEVSGLVVEKCQCGRYCVPKDGEVWEVWRKEPDSVMLKYLYDQLAGRASMKDEEQLDPEITIVFADIDCTDEEVKRLTDDTPPLSNDMANVTKPLGV